MKYGVEISKGQRIIHQFATETERATWLAQAGMRFAITGNSREVKRAQYHGEVFEIAREREKEISHT